MSTITEAVGIAGFILSVILGALKLHSMRKKPKLSIQFENDPRIDTDVYRTELEYINQDGTLSGVFRKFLKIRVLNTGNAVAHRCKAELRIKSTGNTAWVPSNKPLPLVWDGLTYEKDIGTKKGREVVAVLLSDSRLQTAAPQAGQPYCLAATVESYNPSTLIRMQDALGHGTYEGTITVRCDEGVIAEETFVITVDNNWRGLEMQKAS